MILYAFIYLFVSPVAPNGVQRVCARMGAILYIAIFVAFDFDPLACLKNILLTSIWNESKEVRTKTGAYLG